MTVRVAYTLCGNVSGGELAELKGLVSLLPQGFGDDMLRFGGLGERITAAMNNNPRPTDEQKQKYFEIVKWAAERGLTLTMHWNNDASVGTLLDIFERVNAETPIANLRWSIAHLNDASDASLRRMKALGVGWAVQDAMYFGGDGYVQQAGADAARRAQCTAYLGGFAEGYIWNSPSRCYGPSPEKFRAEYLATLKRDRALIGDPSGAVLFALMERLSSDKCEGVKGQK